MTSTDTTGIPVVDRMAGHRMAAAVAVLQHGIFRHLPEPSNVAIEPDVIQLRLPPHTFNMWAASLEIDGEKHSQPGSPEIVRVYGPCRRWTVVGRLPDTGVRVEITGHMLASVDEVA